ncbi:MAG: hypothetical protein CM15mP9_3000 [Methanobacteriota archaeon]|nr:MAG: hypothetical protein CM15mP9_3000 [Euryarchaeota archaeon]
MLANAFPEIRRNPPFPISCRYAWIQFYKRKISFETLANRRTLSGLPRGEKVDKLRGKQIKHGTLVGVVPHSVNEEIDDVGFIEKMIDCYSKYKLTPTGLRLWVVKWPMPKD